MTTDNKKEFGQLSFPVHDSMGVLVHFVYLSPPKATVLMPLWTLPNCFWTANKMMNKDSRFSRKMHGNFSTRRHSCIGYVSSCVLRVLWVWLQWLTHHDAFAGIQEVLESLFLYLESTYNQKYNQLMGNCLTLLLCPCVLSLCWCLSGGFMCFIPLCSRDVSGPSLRVPFRLLWI